MPEIGTRATVFCYREARYLKGEKKEGILVSRKPVKLETKCYKYCVTIVRR